LTAMAELLSAYEAERIGLDFIRTKYWRGKVAIDQTELVTAGAFPVYHCAGTIKMKPRGIMGRFVFTEAPFSFSVRIHALEGSVVGYELR
jgi:hypothetical protein